MAIQGFSQDEINKAAEVAADVIVLTNDAMADLLNHLLHAGVIVPASTRASKTAIAHFASAVRAEAENAASTKTYASLTNIARGLDAEAS